MSAPLEQVFKLIAETGDLERMIDQMGVASKTTSTLDSALKTAERDVAILSRGVGFGAGSVLRMSDAELKLARASIGLAHEEATASHGARDMGKNFAEAAIEASQLDGVLGRLGHFAGLGGGGMLGAIAGGAAGFLVFEGLTTLVEKVIDLGKEMIGAAAQAERLDHALELTFGSDTGKMLSEYGDRIAQITYLTDDQIKGLILDMGKAGVALEDIPKNLATAADVAARAKDPVAAMSQTVEIFSEAARRGVVNMRLLRGLGIGPDQLKTLPQFANLNREQLNKALEEGKIGAVDLRNLLARNNAMLGMDGVRAANEMGVALKNLKNAPEQIFQEFKKTQAFADLSSKLADLAAFLAPDGPGGKKIIGFLELVEDKAMKAIHDVDFKAWGDVLLQTLEAIPPILNAISSGLGKINSFLGFDSKDIGGGKKLFLPPESPTGVTGIPGSAGQYLGEHGPTAWIRRKILSRLGFETVGKDVAAGLQQGITLGAPGAADAAAAMASGAHAAAKDALDSHSPSRLAMGLGEDYAEGWGIGLERGLSTQRQRFSADDFAGAPGVKGGTSVGGVELNVTTVVHASGNPHEIAQATEQHLSTVLPAQLAALFERFATQGGS